MTTQLFEAALFATVEVTIELPSRLATNNFATLYTDPYIKYLGSVEVLLSKAVVETSPSRTEGDFRNVFAILVIR